MSKNKGDSNICNKNKVPQMIALDVPDWVVRMFEEACAKTKIDILPDIAIRFLCNNFLSWAEDNLFLKEKKALAECRQLKTSLHESFVEIINRIDYNKILNKNSDQLLDIQLKGWLNRNILNRL